MAYVKTVWATGDVITAAKLNNAENGIEATAIVADAALPKAGGTMTGPVNFDDANNFVDKINAAIGMTMRSDARARVEAKTVVDLAQNAYHDGTNWMRFDIALPALILEGESGSFKVYTVGAGANPITWSGPYTVWHSNNDGAGSGLDADLLDGLHASSFAPAISAAAKVYHSVSQSIATTTPILLAFDTEKFDTDTIHDNVTNNSRLTCKTAGKYLITVSVNFAANSTGYREVSIRLNGTSDIAKHRSNAIVDASVIGATTVYDLAVNDYVEVIVYQNSGGALNVNRLADYSPDFSMVKVG